MSGSEISKNDRMLILRRSQTGDGSITSTRNESTEFVVRRLVQDVFQDQIDTTTAKNILDALCKDCPLSNEWQILARNRYFSRVSQSGYPIYFCSARGMRGPANCKPNTSR
jgi:hypothetical protein